MANFYSMKSTDFPGRGTAGDVYFATDTHALSICIPGGNLIPMDQLWSGNANVQIVDAAKRTVILNAVFDGAGQALGTTVGPGFPVPYDCTVTGVMLFADAPGHAVIDIKRTSFAGYPASLQSIFSTSKPTLNNAQAVSVEPNLWQTQIAKGDVLQFALDSASGITNLTVALILSVS